MGKCNYMRYSSTHLYLDTWWRWMVPVVRSEEVWYLTWTCWVWGPLWSITCDFLLQGSVYKRLVPYLCRLYSDFEDSSPAMVLLGGTAWSPGFGNHEAVHIKYSASKMADIPKTLSNQNYNNSETREGNPVSLSSLMIIEIGISITPDPIS
jgi:hypothetical protein